MNQNYVIDCSIVVPIYFDGELAERFVNAFISSFSKYYENQNLEDNIELIFVDDGSQNDSIRYLTELANKYSFIKLIELSRNFGQHIALSAGFEYASGNFVGMTNVDMQDPLDEFPNFIDLLKKKDIDIVYGLCKKRETSLINKITSRLFHLFLNKLTGYTIPTNVTTMRMMNRKFINAYNQFNEKSRYLPGLEMWLGFKKGYVRINQQKRTEGKSSYTFRKRLSIAFNTVLSFSDLPLRIITFVGIVISLLGILMTIGLVISKLFFVDFSPGYTSTISIIVFLSGIQTLVLGVASMYIGRILKEVQQRPLYVIRNKINL